MKEFTSIAEFDKAAGKAPSFMYVDVTAQDVRKVGENRFRLVIPAREVSSDQAAMLDELFPHTQNHIKAALRAEALIAASLPEKADAPGDYNQR